MAHRLEHLMGCDIHIIAQVCSDEGAWRTVETKPDGIIKNRYRNYHLFGRLAGVRDETVAPIMPPRWLPPDLAMRYSHDVCGTFDSKVPGLYSAEHSITWLSVGDMRKGILAEDTWRCRALIQLFWELEELVWKHFKCCADISPHEEKVRIVFGFDS